MSRSRVAILAAVLLLVIAGLVAWWLLPHETGSIVAHAPTAAPSTAAEVARDRGGVAPSAGRGADGGLAARTRTSTKPAVSSILFEVAWGSGPGQLGHREANESNPEGPGAIAVDGDDVVVLDHVNGRVQRFRRGVPFSSFEVSDTVQDLALAKNGNTVVLDRLADKSVTIHGPDGARIAEIPLEGKGIEDPGLTTGVFSDDDGVWVEREHGNLVHVASNEGAADAERKESPGRRTRDGRRVVTAAIADAAAGRAVVTAFNREDLTIAWAATYDFSRPLLHLLLLESDDAGNVYLGGEGARERADFTTYDAAIMVVRFGVDGSVTGLVELPSTASGDEIGRPLAVGADGAVYVMQTTTTGVVMTRHTFP